MTPTKKLMSRLLISAALALTPLIAFTPVTAFAAAQVGTSAAVRGDAYVTTSGAQRRAQVRDAIKLQDKILTKDDSALQILLLDRTTFTVGQNASVTIDKFVYDPNSGKGEVAAKVAKGAFRFMSGDIGKNNPADTKVSTPSATIGIRGTIVEAIVGPDAIALAGIGGLDTGSASSTGATIVVLRGPGSLRNTLDRPGSINVTSGGQTIAVQQPGYAVFVPGPGQAPIGPFEMTAEMQDYLDFFLRSAPSGPSRGPATSIGSQESGQHVFEGGQDTIDVIIPDDPAVPTEGIEDVDQDCLLVSSMMPKPRKTDVHDVLSKLIYCSECDSTPPPPSDC